MLSFCENQLTDAVVQAVVEGVYHQRRLRPPEKEKRHELPQIQYYMLHSFILRQRKGVMPSNTRVLVHPATLNLRASMDQVTHSLRSRLLPSVAKLVLCTHDRRRATLPKWSLTSTSTCKQRRLVPLHEINNVRDSNSNL